MNVSTELNSTGDKLQYSSNFFPEKTIYKNVNPIVQEKLKKKYQCYFICHFQELLRVSYVHQRSAPEKLSDLHLDMAVKVQLKKTYWRMYIDI